MRIYCNTCATGAGVNAVCILDDASCLQSQCVSMEDWRKSFLKHWCFWSLSLLTGYIYKLANLPKTLCRKELPLCCVMWARRQEWRQISCCLPVDFISTPVKALIHLCSASAIWKGKLRSQWLILSTCSQKTKHKKESLCCIHVEMRGWYFFHSSQFH